MEQEIKKLAQEEKPEGETLCPKCQERHYIPPGKDVCLHCLEKRPKPGNSTKLSE